MCIRDRENMEPVDGSNWTDILDANWKSVRDVDNEGYHVRQAHPSLFDLYGQDYSDEPFLEGTSRSVGTFNTKPSKKWLTRLDLSIGCFISIRSRRII